jgi:C4-dicarboxylate-specific signal transduction histidine kinase
LILIFVPFFIWLYFNNKLQLQIEADNTYKNKLISLAEMSGGIAHEINNPLTVITGRTNQIIRKIKNNDISPDEIIKNLEKIYFSSERISKIIKAMKNFSRNEENQNLQTSTLKDLIEDTLLLCENRINNDETNLEIDSIPSVEIQCHPFQIVQILINLINNSFDATSTLSEKWIKISFQIKNNLVLITITDSGKGIPKDYRKKIFDPFFTSKQLTFGTGLGLSISKKIALAHKGELLLDEECPNTCFVLSLPINLKKN